MRDDPHFIPSTLKVTASENLDVSQDLQTESDKTIAELLNPDEKEEKDEAQD